MIACQSSIGQWRGLARIKIADGNEKTRRWNDQVIGHAAVATEAAWSFACLVLAIILHARPAIKASPAPPWSIDEYRVSDSIARRARSELLHPTGVLMAQGEGK